MSSEQDLPVIHTIKTLRETIRGWRAENHSIALVPTMGALHRGHLSLVEAARAQASRVVVTIFVNPTQFAAGEDFSKYPRTLDADVELLRRVKTDACFAPAAEEIYPPGFSTRIEPGGPALAGLDDAFRPTHFCGVATVVAKLLAIAQADVAIFGEKDYQQLLVIRRLALDLDIETRILAAPTLREPDGLAMSSRNAYLSPSERALSPALYRTLAACAGRLIGGEAADAALEAARLELRLTGFALDYLELRDASSLAPLKDANWRSARLLAAANLGRTRLIDNIAVDKS